MPWCFRFTTHWSYKLFQRSKEVGRYSVVSVTNDQFVNKGPGRPAFKIKNRLAFLKEINCVDYVCISNAPTAEKIIKNLKPNVYCKGADYLKLLSKR